MFYQLRQFINFFARMESTPKIAIGESTLFVSTLYCPTNYTGFELTNDFLHATRRL